MFLIQDKEQIMICKKCGQDAHYESQKELCEDGKKIGYATELTYRCDDCGSSQAETSFHSSGRYDFASLSQPDG